jgi:uncharacterized protein YgiM (DUF1202 family)
MKNKVLYIVTLSILIISVSINFYQYFENERNEASLIRDLNEQSESFENRIASVLEEKEKYRIRASEAEYELNNLGERSKNIQPIDRSNHLIYETLKQVDLREFMTSGSAVITSIKRGEKFTVLNSFHSENWEIEYNGNRGWITVKEKQYNEFGIPNGTIPTIEKVR